MFRLLLFLTFLLLALGAADELKLVSYNIRYDAKGDRGFRDWPNRKQGLIQFLQEGEFSVMGLQEVLQNQLEDLEKGLPKFATVGVGRSDGKKGGEYSPILFDTEVWKVDSEQTGTFWLSDTPEKAGSKSWGNSVTRICTWARLVGKSGEGIYVFNTHFDHKSQASREKAADLILARIKVRRFLDEPVFLMGDFNATRSNPAVQTFLKSGLLIDPGQAVQKLTFNRWESGLKGGLRIDHIFMSSSIGEATFEILLDGDPPHSDHHPVLLSVPD